MKKLFLAVLVLFISQINFAQLRTGVIKGLVVEKQSGEPIPFANVILMQDSKRIMVTSTDFDGVYTLKPLPLGIYDVQFEYIGFSSHKVSEVEVDSLKLVVVDAEMSKGVHLEEVLVYTQPIIEIDQTETGASMARSEITQMAVRSVADITKSAGSGVYSRDNGLFTRGSRRGNSVTYIDGIRYVGMKENKVISRYDNESYQKLADNEFASPISEPLSTFSIDVDKASYANTRRYLNEGLLPPPNAVRIEELINYFNYDYPQPAGEHPFSITTELTSCPWNTERKLALIGLQGSIVEMETAPKSNLVFLIDVSGSMGDNNKLPLLKKGLGLLVEKMREDDRIAIVVYAGAAGQVLKSTKGDKKELIQSVLNNLSAGGSTAGGEGIHLAYSIAEKHFMTKGNNRVILATDGDFNVGVSGQKELVELIEEKRKTGVFLSVLGFGSGNLQDHKMEQLADKGNGNYNYIDNILEAKKVLVSEMGGTLYIIAKDVKIQAEFNPAKVKAYRLLGYVNRSLAAEDFNDDTKDAGELGSGHSVTVLYEIIPTSSTEKIKDIDKLKYQRTKPADVVSEELLTVKFRYKQPKGEESTLITKVLKDKPVKFETSSNNMQFSAAVASFGMKLRKSKSVKKMEFNAILELAKAAKGSDEKGYRAEFIKLVEMAELIK